MPKKLLEWFYHFPDKSVSWAEKNASKGAEVIANFMILCFKTFVDILKMIVKGG